MGLCVDLGLERFYYGDQAGRLQAIEMLVREGFAAVLREVFQDGRVFEARRDGDLVAARWLSSEESAPILADIERMLGGVNVDASFSWDQLDALNVGPIKDLAFEIADAAPREVKLPKMEKPATIIHVSDSLVCWPDAEEAEVVGALHWLATEHHLIVHSA